MRMEDFDGVPRSIATVGAYLGVGWVHRLRVQAMGLPVVNAKSWGLAFGLGGGGEFSAGVWKLRGI
jgi:hypothetical protein